MRALSLGLALLLSSCATCQQHPVWCGIGVFAVGAGVLYAVGKRTSYDGQQNCVVLANGTVRCGRLPEG